MRVNRWLLLGVFTICGVGAALAVLAWWPSPGVNKRNFDRIEIGLTFAEVEAIFGAPPGYDCSGWDFKSGRLGRWAQWTDNDGFRRALIDFDESDRVRSSYWNHFDDRSGLEIVLDQMPWRSEAREERANQRRMFCYLLAGMN